MGRTYYVGNHKHDCIKIDMWYTDNFVEDEVVVDKIRLASIPEIIAMKMDVISRGGRKKDFWDIHELKERMEIQQMLDLHQRRYPFSHDPVKILEKLTDFTQADDDFNPVCLRGKHWELIKLDLIEWVNDLRSV